MSVLRVVSLAIVALWVGGTSAMALIAVPAVFTERFRHLTWYLGGGLILLLGLRAALGPRPRRLAIQMALVTVMLAASAFVLAPNLLLVTLGAGLGVFWIETKD